MLLCNSLSNDPNFEYYDPVLIMSSSIISLMLINPRSISNMNISNMSYKNEVNNNY